MASPQNEWVKRRWQALIAERGGSCSYCGEFHDLEFAHTEPTACVGKGRGKYRRLRDILRYPDKYVLLCTGCHDVFDGRSVRRRQMDYVKG